MAAAELGDVNALRTLFQKVQESATAHKLSERNCIEIINKLTSLGLLEVIYTTDGREYLTPQQLEREIRDEVIMNGGRINLVDLQQIINVDLSHIESKVSDLLRNDRTLTLVQGELIDRDYLDRAAEEINEALQDAGQLSVSELSKTFNLSSEFLLSIIEPRLGTQINGQMDPLDRGMLFTESFVARNIAKIRGALSAITRPTPVSSLVSQYELPEKFFASVLERLVSSGRLAGTIQGRLDKAVFIPDIYTQTLNAWISSIFQQDGYLEYDTMQKLGITDGRQFLKRRLKQDEGLSVFLQTCCVGQGIQDHIEAVIEEALTTGSWVHTRPLLPSPLTNDDVNQLLQHCMKSSQKSSSHIFSDGIVVSNQFIDSCRKIFEPLMHEKAENAIRKSPALFAELSKQERASLTHSSKADEKQAKKEERQKKATLGGGQKGGAGRGGRETKTRKTKDKSKLRGRGSHDDDDDDDDCNDKRGSKDASSMLLTFMSQEEIEAELNRHLNFPVADLARDLSEYLDRQLSQDYKEVAKSVFNNRSGKASSSSKKSHAEYQEKINGLYANARLFEKGIKLLDADTQVHLSKHLLKSVCQDIVNLIFEMVAAENLLTLAEDDSFTTETRLKLLNKLSGPIKGPLTKLNSSLSAKSLDDFFDQLDIVTDANHCDVMLKKLDKKKERQLAFNHRQALVDQLEKETEPAMALHLAAVILFQYQTTFVIHAPGRCVPQIINFLQDHVSAEAYDQLSRYQALVVKSLSKKSCSEEETGEDGEAEASASSLLAEGLQDIKNLTVKSKKSVSE